MPSLGERLGQNRLLIVAFAAFGLSTVLAQGLAIALAVIGMASLALSIINESAEQSDGSLDRWVFGVIVLFAVLSIVGPFGVVIGSPPSWIFASTGIAWLTLALGWRIAAAKVRARQVIYALVMALTAVVGAIHITSAEGLGYDVLFLHHAAADAISEGVSPYSSAVMVPNGAPVGAEFIEGYPYPPLTVLAYAFGDWIGDDPRWTSLVGWLVSLAVIGSSSLRRGGGRMPLGTMIAAAAIPAWPLVLTTGWTEALSLALLASAVFIWARPRMSGFLTGLFVGSKQYLLAATPLFALNGLNGRWTRARWAALAFVTSLLPVLVWGVQDFADAAIRFHLEAPARTDGTSVVGLFDLFDVDWVPPLWLMVVAVVAVTVAVRRHVVDVRRWLAALGVILSTALFLSSQAFTNYWFLMAGIAALAAGTNVSSSEPRESLEATIAPEQTPDP